MSRRSPIVADRDNWQRDAEHLRAVNARLQTALEETQQAIRVHIVEMDKLMLGPTTKERGAAIANLVSDLQVILGESE